MKKVLEKSKKKGKSVKHKNALKAMVEGNVAVVRLMAKRQMSGQKGQILTI